MSDDLRLSQRGGRRYLGRRRPPDYMLRLDLFDIVQIDGAWWAVRKEA